MNKDRCKKEVWDSGRFLSRRCLRDVWKDGYCKQHHPDTVAERDRKSAERYQKELENSPYRLLEKANLRIKELEEELAKLKTGIIYDDVDGNLIMNKDFDASSWLQS